MKVDIKVLNQQEMRIQRVYLCEIEDVRTSQEVIAEVYRGRQAVGNGYQTMIRCGTDENFYGVTTKSEIIAWTNRRLKEDRA